VSQEVAAIDPHSDKEDEARLSKFYEKRKKERELVKKDKEGSKREKEVTMTDVLKELVARRADVNCPDSEGGFTPLHHACRDGWLEVARILVLSKTVYVKAASKSTGATPLHEACKNGHLKVAELILKCDSSAAKVTDNMKRKPLHEACIAKNAKLVELLSKHSGDISWQDENGNTPLHEACRSGDIKTLRTILKFQPPAKLHDVKGRTARDVAAELCHSDVVLLM
jgi:ankyrin repeat protein